MPSFQATQVGSWPRSDKMLSALRERRMGRMEAGEFNVVADGEIRRCVALQEEAGVDIVVDGKLRRDNFRVNCLAPLAFVTCYRLRNGDQISSIKGGNAIKLSGTTRPSLVPRPGMPIEGSRHTFHLSPSHISQSYLDDARVHTTLSL